MGFFEKFKIILRVIGSFFIFFISDLFSKTHPSRVKVYWRTIKAFFYGYPLLLMYKTCQVMTATNKISPPNAPINHFAHMQSLPDHTTKNIIVAPNVDTLYSVAWLDLTKEPIILSLPALPKNRYYLMPLLDAWTNVFKSLGTRTTGNQPGNYVIIGPSWKGKLPNDLTKIEAPTNMVWILGRTLVSDASDCQNVIDIQNKYLLTPLSDWGKKDLSLKIPDFDPTINTKALPDQQVYSMDENEFFNQLCLLMKDNPPASKDEKYLNSLAEIGIQKDTPYNNSAIVSKTSSAFKRGYSHARTILNLTNVLVNPKKIVHGWQTGRFGNYGNHYFRRAAIAKFGFGANLPEDTIYFRTVFDYKKKFLTGGKKYILHFPSKQLPPVNAFWSLTLYNLEHFLVQNHIQRYALGNRDRMQFNLDGSLDIYIQHEPPEKEKMTNWLPSPADHFSLILRLYWPTEDVINNQWYPPLVRTL